MTSTPTSSGPSSDSKTVVPYKVSDLTYYLVIAHIIVSAAVIVGYDNIAALKKKHFVNQYKNVILWLVSGIVLSLILADMYKGVELPYGNTEANSFRWDDATRSSKALLVLTVLHLVISIALLVPYSYDMIIDMVPTKKYKNQLLWGVSFVVCLLMFGAIWQYNKKSETGTSDAKKKPMSVTIKYQPDGAAQTTTQERCQI